VTGAARPAPEKSAAPDAQAQAAAPAKGAAQAAVRLAAWGCAAAALALALAGCAALAERAGRALDGSAFAQRSDAVYRTAGHGGGSGIEAQRLRSRGGRGGEWEYSLAILPERFPSVKIRASAPDESGAFILASLDYLGGNEHGWNEFSMDLFGSGMFAPADPGAAEGAMALSVRGGIEPVQISFGRIRRYDTRIAGEQALSYLRNRGERILALTEWMRGQGAEMAGAAAGGSAESIAEFERRWRPALFPEASRRRHRPPGWQQAGDRRSRAGGIAWNACRTARAFPEHLREVRDSGTLLRDWEEALEWIHLKYEWDSLAEALSRGAVLERAR